MKKHLLLYSFAMMGVAALGMAGLGGGEASAASVTVPSLDYPGTAAGIQAAVDQANSGDVITISDGEFALTDFINIEGKSGITIEGSGDTILTYDGKTASTLGVRQAIRILDSDNIVIDDIEIRAANSTNEAVWADASSGIGINSSCDVTLSNMSIVGFGGQGGVLVTKLADNGVHACSAENITFDTMIFNNNNIGIFFTDGATNPPNATITGVVFEGKNIFTAGNYNLNYAIASNSQDGGTIGVGVYGPNGAQLNVGMFWASGYPDHQWLAVKGQVALVGHGSLLDGVAVESISATELANTYCLMLEEDQCPEGMVEDEDGNCVCPEGMVEDEDGNCACPEGMVEDEDGNCVCPEGSEMNEDGECVPVPGVPDTGGNIIRDLVQSGAVWMIGISGGVMMGVVLVARWAKRYNRIKL
ncbi:hypothetical protein LJC07_06355 [Christensenellaceae bacterium OttesenSCG-928-L17]|nr:hypothetical protein [Christensenellaceae bacterium OttesenSCG-928-L17]